MRPRPDRFTGPMRNGVARLARLTADNAKVLAASGSRLTQAVDPESHKVPGGPGRIDCYLPVVPKLGELRSHWRTHLRKSDVTQPPHDQPPYGPGHDPKQPFGQQPGQPYPPQQSPGQVPAKRSRKGLIGGLIAGFFLGSLVGCIGGVGIGSTGSTTTAVPGAATTVTAPAATTTVSEKAKAAATVTEKAAPAPTVTVTEKAPEPKPEPEPEEEIGDGSYLVGSDIKPGTWKSSGAEGGLCYADTKTENGGILEQEVANEGSVIIRITKRAYTFESRGCGTWKKVG
jgi:hypothetical protein